ncbi:hypothetical protein Tco_0745168 [Tanacetum coccineum]
MMVGLQPVGWLRVLRCPGGVDGFPDFAPPIIALSSSNLTLNSLVAPIARPSHPVEVNRALAQLPKSHAHDDTATNRAPTSAPSDVGNATEAMYHYARLLSVGGILRFATGSRRHRVVAVSNGWQKTSTRLCQLVAHDLMKPLEWRHKKELEKRWEM